MVNYFRIKDITLGAISRATGHEAYLHARYNPPDERGPYNIIYKKNKRGRSELTRFEVGFSQLSQLCLPPDLTPFLRIVVDDDTNILGMAVQHLCYVIEKREKGLDKNFYRLNNPKVSCDSTPLKANTATEIPYYFMDKLPHGFYSHLVEEERRNRLTIDYESLASLFATSYTLEEDDLHKGNFGFYLIEKDGKPHAVFFKIDHDLMFVDSIMGFQTRRPFHFFQGAHAFDITRDDLKSLTRLTHSSNSYWPTKFSYFSNPFGTKEYHSFAEIDAFANLGTHPDFIKAKWMSFLKHILISPDLIEQTLKGSADVEKARDRADIALISQATTARLARLRAALFSIKEFREFVANLTEDQTQSLLDEVVPPHLVDIEHFAQQAHQSLTQYKILCQQENGFEEGDTPLHTAIKLGQYRYQETLRMFGQFINVKNRAGKTPLDVALDRMNSPADDRTEMQTDVRCIMSHLLKHGANKTPKYMQSNIEQSIETYQFTNPYLKKISRGMNYEEFKEVLRDLGEDHRLCLKSKKNLALECVARFIQVNENHPHAKRNLTRLSNDLNGESSEEECAGIKYIRQLRSKLWIVRQMRGLYGMSSTLWDMNNMISKAIERVKNREPNYGSFFPSYEYSVNDFELRPEPAFFPARDDLGFTPL